VAHHNLGVALGHQGKLDEAIGAYRTAIAIQPGLIESYCNLAVALRDQGRLDEAVDCCRQAIAIGPRSAEAYSNLGMALWEQGKAEEATSAYRHAIAINPDYAEAIYNLGMALLKQGKTAEAIAELSRAIILDPHLADAHHGLGQALSQAGRFSESHAALEEAIRLDPHKPRYRLSLGALGSLNAEQQLVTLQDLLKNNVALSRDDQIVAHFALGDAYNDLAQPRDAFREWMAANALKRQHIAYDEAGALGEMARVPNIFTSAMIQSFRDSGTRRAFRFSCSA
jgi:tetratricopeptide (TPR) repeat protein